MDESNTEISPSFKRILIYRIGNLGDMTVALPTCWTLRRNFPDAEITMLTSIDSQNPEFIRGNEVLPDRGLVDSWMFYPSNKNRIGLVAGYLKLLVELRRRRFDALFYLMLRSRTPAQIRRDARFFSLAGIRKIFGLTHLKKNILDPAKYPRPLPRINAESDFLLGYVRSEGLAVEETSPGLALSEDELTSAKSWLESVCGSGYEQRPLIAVSPGAKWDSKIWDEARYQRVVENLISARDVFPIIFGGPELNSKADRMIAGWQRGAKAAGVLNVREAAAAMSFCKLFLGNDTGTMHLAAAVGVPCVAIFSSIDFPGRWYPAGERNAVFRTEIECEGCLLADCPVGKRCLDEIGVPEVLAACEDILAKA